MTATELITKLQGLVEEHGDLPVYIFDSEFMVDSKLDLVKVSEGLDEQYDDDAPKVKRLSLRDWGSSF